MRNNTTGPIAILRRQPEILDAPVPLPMQTAIIHRAPPEEIEDRSEPPIGRQTVIVHRAAPERIDEGSEAPIGRWAKVIAFTIGLTAAIGGYMFVMPRVAAWRTSAVSHLTAPTSAPQAVADPASPAAMPSLGEANPDSVQVVDHPAKKAAAHKASRAKRRHPPKHRTASRH